jgi:bacterioferritin-associated ferredoxin
MIVCHCHGISDRKVRQVVRDGARTRRQVARACGAGASCGDCRPAIGEIIRKERAREATSSERTVSVAAGS